MNKTQINRVWRKMFARATRLNGYQPWGYDLRTLWVTEPALMRARTRLQAMHKQANK